LEGLRRVGGAHTQTLRVIPLSQENPQGFAARYCLQVRWQALPKFKTLEGLRVGCTTIYAVPTALGFIITYVS
jgi:hypothetical protein